MTYSRLRNLVTHEQKSEQKIGNEYFITNSNQSHINFFLDVTKVSL